MRGEVVLFGEATPKASLEYGQDEDSLVFSTRQTSVRTAYNRAIRAQATKPEEKERYYFRLVSQDNNGNVTYGTVFAFRTDELDD
ncbi:MAG: hypothetical protein ACI9BF_000301 [Candidatus Paceibacteria bacterium]